MHTDPLVFDYGKAHVTAHRLPLVLNSVKARCICNGVPITASSYHEFISTTITFDAQLKTIIRREIFWYREILQKDKEC